MRPEASAKLGYYPCPLLAVEMIAQKITADSEAVIVDPCAGEGEAVAALADFLGVDHSQIVAAELEQHRSEKLAERLVGATVSKRTDFQSSAFLRERATCMWLNPPFDNETGNLGHRCELTFLARATPMLKSGGLLILIMPEQRIPEVRLYLQNNYRDAQKFVFPPAVRKFKEVAIIATKRDKPLNAVQADFRTLEYPVMGAVYHAGRGDTFEILKQSYTDADLQELLKFDLLAIKGDKRDQGTLRPPLQLGTGHIALLLAAGHLNGRVHKAGEAPHVVRGTARKIEVVKEQTKDSKEVTTVSQEKIELVIRLARQNGEIEDLSNA